MKFSKLSLPIVIALAASHATADETNFDKFMPLAGDTVAGSLPESAPFVLSSSDFRQVNIVTRGDVYEAPRFDSGDYDMHTVNESGPDAGRYLFAPYETDQAGIQRTDLTNMQTETIFAAANPGDYVAFDASRWTPWGTYLTAEESWSDPGAQVSRYGRLFEVKNPLADPAGIQIVHRDILPRVSHEGLAFDAQNNLYFIDERNDSHIFKYTPVNPKAKTGDQYFGAGQSFVLRVGDGTVEEATGKARWIPLTDKVGNPLPGVVLVYGDEIDGRATPNLPQFLGTNFDRPEDLEIKTLRNKKQILFVATTTNDKVFSIDLTTNVVKLFASQATMDMATGMPAGSAFNSPDNLAIDADGNIYVVEDQPGGIEDTWFALDEDNDGVAEAIGKWASLTTIGAEATGLYFDPFNPHIAYINVQHPTSGQDRTIMLMASPVESDKGKHHGRK